MLNMKQETRPASSPYTENWVRVKSIKDGIITLPTKEMVTGVKVQPKNIFIMEQSQQDGTLNALKNCYNTFNFEFWLICADKPVDLSIYRSQIEMALNNETNPQIRKILNQDLGKISMFMNNQVVDTEYFLLFKEKNIDMLNSNLRAMIDGFANCGMLASKVTNDDLRNILDNFLNGGVRTNFGSVVVK